MARYFSADFLAGRPRLGLSLPVIFSIPFRNFETSIEVILLALLNGNSFVLLIKFSFSFIGPAGTDDSKYFATFTFCKNYNQDT